MSVIKGKKLQLGYDGTASNNFTLYQPGTPDGTLRLANGIAGAETDLITLTSAGYMGIGKTNPNAPLTIGRMNSAEEGGEISLCRSSDNSSVWSIDAYGSTSTPSLRFIDNVAGAARMVIDGSGNIGVNNSSPSQYNTSGKVLNIGATAVNSGPATVNMGSGSGAGYYTKEVFPIASVTSATEITRNTGTSADGFRAYIKITVTGHTGGIGNGINIKEFYWDGGTSAPVQISTYTNGSVPVISFDNSTSNVWIVRLASSNGSAAFNGVMMVEWLMPIDFSGAAWTIS